VKSLLKFCLFALVLFCPLQLVSTAQAAPTSIQWLGHAAFKITTPQGHVLLIDPWVANPQNPDKEPLKGLTKVDYILVTHGHFDHLGQAVEIGKQSGAKLIANFELGSNLTRVLGFPKEQAGFDTLMNMGGEISIAKGEVTVAMTPAVHSSSLEPSSESQSLCLVSNSCSGCEGALLGTRPTKDPALSNEAGGNCEL